VDAHCKRETTGVGDYEISTDKRRLDVGAIHRWLAEESYWAIGRTRGATDRAIGESFCVGAYAADGEQAGFARVVTDKVTFSWICDVFVFEAHRGNGLARRMVTAAMEHPDLASVRVWLLATADAHGVYEPLGFAPTDPKRWMAMRRESPDAGTWRDPPA
jgi:GNAT superfamily N-acetyltransferase